MELCTKSSQFRAATLKMRMLPDRRPDRPRVLAKEMMAQPTISLAMMSLMQTLVQDDSPDMAAPRAALMKRLEEVATKEWLTVLRDPVGKSGDH